MNLRELVNQAREDLDDTAPQPLWSDAFLKDAANDAVNEAVLRGRLLNDSRTPDVCRITLRIGRTEYQLHESILVIKRAKLTSSTSEIRLLTTDELDFQGGDWESSTGEPRRGVLDRNTRTLTLDSAPTEQATMVLDVWRTPIASERMTAWDNCPVACLHPAHHRNLVHWMLHRAYDRKDSETFDPGRSDDQETKFERAFGPRPSAHAIELWRARRNQRTRAFFLGGRG